MSTETTAPPVLLSDLLDTDELAEMLGQGYVRRQEHPSMPLVIYNYAEKAAYERVWNDVTRQCRGLIVHAVTGAVIARPFEKFFNYGEHPEDSLDLATPASVTDKLDGSLGILYPASDGWAIATRGSFASDQAVHATALLRDRYPDFEPPDGMTVLFEVIFPANRIVVDYGALDDLVLLGAVDIASGETVGPDWISLWPGPLADTMHARTLAEALEMPPRDGREGVVVRMASGVMVKIKQADYVQLHALVTGLNARVVWERVGNGETAAEICTQLPDEFHEWVNNVADELAIKQQSILNAARHEHERILGALPEGWQRKDYALAAMQSPLKAWLFNLLDGKDPSAGIWRIIRPSGDRKLVAYSEDTA